MKPSQFYGVICLTEWHSCPITVQNSWICRDADWKGSCGLCYQLRCSCNTNCSGAVVNIMTFRRKFFAVILSYFYLCILDFCIQSVLGPWFLFRNKMFALYFGVIVAPRAAGCSETSAIQVWRETFLFTLTDAFLPACSYISSTKRTTILAFRGMSIVPVTVSKMAALLRVPLFARLEQRTCGNVAARFSAGPSFFLMLTFACTTIRNHDPVY